VTCETLKRKALVAVHIQ